MARDPADIGGSRPRPALVPGNVSDLISLISKRTPRVALALAAGQVAMPTAKQAWAWAKDQKTYTIKVLGGYGSDGLYDDLHAWVLSVLPPSRQRALVAYVPRTRCWDGDDNDFTRPEKKRIRLRYDGSREQDIQVSGHRVSVSVTDGSGSSGSQNWKPPEIIFTMKNVTARDAMLRQLERILESLGTKERVPVFRMLDTIDSWETIDSLQRRPLESIILPAGQMDCLVADLGRFLDSEAEYSRRSIPWHRGYLFHGPPGTGKTSVARALASHFKLDVWLLPLADVKKDTNLIRLVSQITPYSVLVLEDIDIYHAARDRDDDAGTSTLSGLLNSLDGLTTPHGLVKVLTTNDKSELDPALTRPGRIDVTEEFRPSGPDEAVRLVARWFDVSRAEVPCLPPWFEMTAADITEMLKQSSTIGEAVSSLEKGVIPERIRHEPEAAHDHGT